MVSIHTFEFMTALSKKEQLKIKEKLKIQAKHENWTEHRYSNRGIQIILYKGKTKKFIYLKYQVNLKRIFDGNDYLHLLEPSDKNIDYIWQTIKQTWDEIGGGIPFGRFYLSRLDFTCDIYLESNTLVQEYIRLLRKGILLPNAKKYSVEGIYHKEDLPTEIKETLQQNACKYKITNLENIQYYNKMYQLQNENLPIPEDAPLDNSILRIELQIHKTKRITQFLQEFGIHSKPIEEQFAFFMINAEFFLLNRLERLYPHGRYHTKNYIKSLVQSDTTIKNKTKKNILQFVFDCNRQNTLGRCLEIDSEMQTTKKRKKSLNYLTSHQINPIIISSSLKEYSDLPDIFELISTAATYPFKI